MQLSNYRGNVYSYDEGLGIEPDIIDYIKESHLIQSRVSPTRCYLLWKKREGEIVPSKSGFITLSSFFLTDNQYKGILWPINNYDYPDLRPYIKNGIGNLEVYVDDVLMRRVLDKRDIINDNEYSIKINHSNVEIYFNENFNPNLYSFKYKYITLDSGMNLERMKEGETPHNSMFGWEQYLDYNDSLFKRKHQILVRTPLTTTNLILNEEGKVELEENQCWMIWEPYIRDWDILVIPEEESPTGRELRFIVENKQDSKIQGQLVSQRFKIKLLEESDDRYKIPYIKEEDISTQPIDIIEYYSNIIETPFNHVSSQFLIGNISKPNSRVVRVILDITSSFSGGDISVGTLINPYNVLPTGSINIQEISTHLIHPDTDFITTTDIYLFLHNTPSFGEGRVILYYM